METCPCNFRADKRRPLTYWLPFHYHRVPGRWRLWIRARLYPKFRLTVPTELCDCQRQAGESVHWPGDKRAAFTLSFDLDSATGLQRALALKADPLFRDRKVTVNMLTHGYSFTREDLRRLREGGWEIGLHGDNHDARLAFERPSRIASRLDRSVSSLSRHGVTPRGFRAPSLLYTQALFRALEGRVAYSSSTAFDDGPFSVRKIFPYRIGRLLELPITMPMDIELRSLGYSAEQIAACWWERYRYLLQHRGHALLVVHLDAHCFDGRIEAALRSFLARVDRAEVWEATCREVSDFFRGADVGREKNRPAFAERT